MTSSDATSPHQQSSSTAHNTTAQSPGAATTAAGGTGTSSSSGSNRAHLNILRDELRDSVMEEERLLDRMAELSHTRSSLRVQVQQREADAEVQGIRRRRERLENTRQTFQL
jgi:hypothetical protein